MDEKRIDTVNLNPERREELYNKCQEAMKEHYEDQPNSETPALVYEAMDVLALLTATIYANLHRADPIAAKPLRRYFRDQFKFYTDKIQNVKPRPDIIKQARNYRQ